MIYKRTTVSGKTRWVVKIYLGTTPDGKKLDKQVGTFDKKKEAEKAEAAAKAALSTAGSDENITEFAERWMRDYPRERASTMRTHSQAVKRFVETHGSRKPDSITKKEARAWVLSQPSSHAALRAMWTDMATEEVASANPFSNLRLKQSKGNADTEPPTQEELLLLMEAAREHHEGTFGGAYASMIEFAAFTGVRRGELVVLTWADIDFEASEIVIDKTLSDDREVLPPKNGKPRRIVLHPRAADALRRLPRPIDKNARIFSTPNGRRFTKSTWHYHWSPVRIEAGMPKLTWHMLRHFCATYMIVEAHVSPHIAAMQLGHSDSGQLLMELYAHLDEDKALAELQAAFARRSSRADVRELRPRVSAHPGDEHR